MNILLLGSGGREHALAWAALQNPKCDKLIVAPGNAGIAQIATCADQTQRSGETLNGTVESIKKLAELMRGVASATTEQIGGIQQISTAVTQMDAVTQQNAALVQQSSSAAGSLEDQASHLKSLVTSFRIPEV